MADVHDTNGDGIRGVPNCIVIPAYVTPRPQEIAQAGRYIGRFGKKASVYNLLQQTVNAYNQDIGITSVFEPVDVYSHNPIDPEVAIATVHDVVLYLQTLQDPIQRRQSDPEVVPGATLPTINCASCHRTE
jgi:CxxC motif-containing protein (DUF1111 family)